MSEKAPLLSSSAHGLRHSGNAGSMISSQIKLLESVPPSITGLALGFCGLGMTWQATDFLAGPAFVRVIADIVSLIGFNIGTTLLMIYLSKAIFAPRHVVSDLMSAAGSSTLPCFDMSLMMLAVWLYGHGLRSAALSIWYFATAMHILVLLIFLRHCINLNLDLVTPSWIIPPIGIALASGTGVSMGIEQSSIFFWIGLGAYFVCFPAALYRVHAHPVPLSDQDMALYAIFAAPSALLLTCWIAMGGHQGHTLTHFLFLAELVCLALVLFRLPTLASLPFCPQQASFTFPSDVAAKAFILYTHLYLAPNGLMAAASWILVTAATAVVFGTFARFCGVAMDAIREPTLPTVASQSEQSL